MTEFLLWVIAILIALIGWGGKQAFGWIKKEWNKHILGEEAFRKSINDEIRILKTGIEMFFEELPPLKKEIQKIPEIEKKVSHVEKDVILIKKKIKI